MAKKPTKKTAKTEKATNISKTVKTSTAARTVKSATTAKTAKTSKTATKAKTAKATKATKTIKAAKTAKSAATAKIVKTAKTTKSAKTTRATKTAKPAEDNAATGYHMGSVNTLISVEDVVREVEKMSSDVSKEDVARLAHNDPFVSINNLKAGYGKMEILHDFNLQVGRGQSLCLIGPNGAGKSTILHSIYGFTNIFSGEIKIGTEGNQQNITELSPNEKLAKAGIAYILQDKSVFPDMTVEENLWMGGFLMDKPDDAKEATERVLAKYDRLAARRNNPAGILSGGERRLLEISRALIMEPDVLLVDEPSIGLEPRFIDMVFEILDDLQNTEGKTIIMVEQNAKKGLEFADIGYVLVSGQLAMAGTGEELLQDPEVGRLFLGG